MTACASWSELFPDLGEPVLGDPGDYSVAVDDAGALAESVGLCSEQFAHVSAGDAAQLHGASAEAIGWMFGEIDGSLHELPAVFESLVAVFAAHRERLDALRTEAASALARAATRWNAVAATAAEGDDAAGALAWVAGQLRAARRAADAGDTTAIARVDALEGEHWYARNRVSAADAAHQDAVDAYESSRVEHAALAEAEAELVRATCDALGEIDLGELRDPSGWRNAIGDFLGAVWDWTGGALVDMVDGVIDAAVALADGRFLDALHHLNDALDEALRLLTTITVAVVAVGTIVCPGALVALPVLLSVGQGLSAAEVAVGGTLLASQHPHPETGATVGLVEVLGAAVAAVMPARLGGGAAVAQTGRAEAAVLARAGAGEGAARTFMRTSAQNAAVLEAAASGSRIVNPATGQAVFGAARQKLVGRATVEAGAYGVQTQLVSAVDEIVVGNATSALVEAGARDGLAAIGPDTERTVNRAVVGAISTQVRSVVDVWRRGPSLRPGAGVYHLTAA